VGPKESRRQDPGTGRQDVKKQMLGFPVEPIDDGDDFGPVRRDAIEKTQRSLLSTYFSMSMPMLMCVVSLVRGVKIAYKLKTK
jgi:hypothetical protein